MLTHRNFVTNACQAAEGLHCRSDGSEISIAALPFFHIYAMTCVMITGIYLGGTVVILPRFELQAALNELQEVYRTPIILFYFEDFSYRDIAEQMDLPIGTVMSRLARAKTYLRSKLMPPESFLR